MRKLVFVLSAFLLLLASIPATHASAETGKAAGWLDAKKVSQGIAAISYEVNAKVKTKLMIAKGKESYTYNLTPGSKTEQFPLQLGNGEYKITILENVSGKSYKAVAQETVKLNLKDDKVVYLNSVQNINWSSTSNAIVKAQELTKNKKTDEDKIKAVYEYITTNIAYDDKLAKTATADYLPIIDRTLKTKKDICYGYASLFAAMLRSLNIPTKMAMGYTDYIDQYHAWNEVYVNGKWMTIDTTLDASLKKAKKKTVMYRDAAKYTKSKQY
ncbi:transglutaminase domain-containing protein [Paenibacillus nanensis]|uniref:Transglutaminase domain-containing protein n=1 Tax=Paenibacillus nanensis TaxID=393251 RepID=A0A3A1UH19_9BACL|nr:transglutaminase-like domain-containing protein [Paenibacillus nanensis]RIX45861.1 transglutaminase domain-containing protein [Paenibacillus nanensis]